MSKYEKFKNLSDEEIITFINDKDTESMDYLMEKYKNLVRQKARTLFLIGGDKDDLIQEGMIGLYKAVRDYKSDRNSTFASFADICVSRQMYSAIKASNRKKNIPLNTYISFYAPICGENADGEDKASIVDFMFQNNNSNPEEMFIDKESTSMIKYKLDEKLSEFEQKVLNLYIEGLTYVQIAKQIGKEPKSVDNALQRIKAKLSLVLGEI